MLLKAESVWCVLTWFWVSLGTLSADGPTVETNLGLVTGRYKVILDKDITAFLGIPFAEPPVGSLRFKKPVPIKPWGGSIEAHSKSPPCMQFASRHYDWTTRTEPSEDCLYLNVWTPGKCCTSEKLPVLVWIHGGGFAVGSTELELYDGSVLASYGKAIIVSMNYRLGQFGFLSSGTDEAPGNVGLHDQNLALKWVHDNIEYFGGDPNKVTLFGESAGSMSVSFQILSPQSKGLFQRAILESGGPSNSIFADDITVNQAKGNAVAQIVGCADNEVNLFTNPDEVIRCLRTKDPMELAKTEPLFMEKLPLFFTPIHGDEFLPKSPIKAIETGDFSDVDVMIGLNMDECTIFLNYAMPQIFPLNKEVQINATLGKQILYAIFQNVTIPGPVPVIQYYMQNITDKSTTDEVMKALVNAYSDFVFNCPSQFFAEKVSNVYFYWMTHRSEKLPWAKWVGVTHFNEVPYVFGVPLKDNENYNQEDCQLSRSIIQKWMSFAESGNPVENSAEVWPKFTADNPQTFELNPLHRRILKFPRSTDCEFWRPYLLNTPQ